MAAAATTVAILTADQWAQRLLRVYPNNWTGDSAKIAGGILYSLFNSQSTQYNFLQNGLDWVLNACRIATAEDVALDAIANDYFGSVATFEATVVRQPGESDDAFRARIYANLLQSGGTRADIIRVVELLTEQVPRIIEPWNVLDTSACDSISYCDVDTAANPSRVGDLDFPYQGFVESILPSFGNQGNNPIYCVDEGLCCDNGFIIDPQPTWFLGQAALDQAINRVRMFGTIVWRYYNSIIGATKIRGNTIFPASGLPSTAINLIPASAQPLAVLATCSWNSSIYVQITDKANFSLNYQASAPGNQGVDYIAAPITTPGYGLLYIPAGATNKSFAIPIPDNPVLVTPNWNTTVWLTAVESGVVALQFGTPAPPGAFLYYGSFAAQNSGLVNVSSGAPSANVTFSNISPGQYQLFLLLAWNTEFSITKTSTGFTVTFSSAPPDDSFFYWGIFY